MSAAIVEAFVPADAIAFYRRNGVTMAGGATAFYQMFLAAQREQPGEPIIPTLRALSGGGAPLPPELFREVRDEMGINICHGYGMTEIPMITQGSPTDSEDQLAHTTGKPVTGCGDPHRHRGRRRGTGRASTARSASRARWSPRGTPTPS